MKTLKILSLLGWAITIAGCDKTVSSISGVYVLNFKNEFTTTNDTLVIQSYNLKAGSYQVERKAGFTRIRDGKTLPREFSKETWMATYDQDKQVLLENANGRLIYIKEDGRFLSYQGTYHKIN